MSAPGSTDVEEAGARLLAIVAELDAAGIDSDRALRTALRCVTAAPPGSPDTPR